MSLSDADVKNQIKHMIGFINQEANEKVEEIDAKAEEEFNIEKGRLVQQQHIKIKEYYDKKLKQIDLQKKIQNSNLLNQSRLKVLQARDEHLKNVLEEGRQRLGQVTKDQAKYKQILEGLITQSLFQLLEKDVVIKCRQQDVTLVKMSLSNCVQQYKQATKREINVTINQTDFLGSHISGGVEVSAHNGKLRVVNTLESRLEQISEQMIPELRAILFGTNPNRKFKD